MFAPLILGVVAGYFIIGFLVMTLTSAATDTNVARETGSGSRGAGGMIVAVLFWPFTLILALFRWLGGLAGGGR